MPPLILLRAGLPASSKSAEQQIPTPQHQTSTPTWEEPFPVTKLPTELRHEIYISYFLPPPPLHITSENASQPFHRHTPLSLSSPFFVFDIPPEFYYRHTTFSFATGTGMKTFCTSSLARQNVRKIIIHYGNDTSPTRDWVHLMNTCFENLEEVEFVLDDSKRGLCAKCGNASFDSWWNAVKDAAREGRCGKNIGLVLKVKEGDSGDFRERRSVC